MKYIKAKIRHFFSFRNKRGFGVHSPQMFKMITEVIKPDKSDRNPLIAKENRNYRSLLRLAKRLVEYEYPQEIYYSDTLFLKYMQSYDDFKNIVFTKNEYDKSKWLVIKGANRYISIMRGIHRNNIKGWEREVTNAKVSIDMMWYGILFYDDKLQKGKYRLTIKK